MHFTFKFRLSSHEQKAHEVSFVQGVAECARHNISRPSVLTRKVTGTILVALAGLWGLLHATLTGRFDSYFIVAQDNGQGYLPSRYASWLVSATMEASFWIGCGILSTAGLGSGVQVRLPLSVLSILSYH